MGVGPIPHSPLFVLIIISAVSAAFWFQVYIQQEEELYPLYWKVKSEGFRP